MISDPMRAWLLRALRVPAEPDVPKGSRIIRVFRAAPGFYRYKLVLWALAHLGVLAGLLFSVIFLTQMQRVTSAAVPLFFLRAGEIFAWAAFLFQLPFSLAALRLDMDMRWYILSDRSLRIREGILSVREKTMTFTNIQQITVNQNPLQRMLGIADVQVRSAGGGGGGGGSGPHGGKKVGESMHEAYFRGVDNAEEIREAIRDRVRLHNEATDASEEEHRLDLVSPPTVPIAQPVPVLAAAQLLHDEVRELRRSAGRLA